VHLARGSPLVVLAIVAIPLSAAAIVFNAVTLGVSDGLGIALLVFGLLLVAAAAVWWRVRGAGWIAFVVAAAAIALLIWTVVRLEVDNVVEIIRVVWFGLVLAIAAGVVHASRRAGAAAATPGAQAGLADLLVAGEGPRLEYKSSLRWDVRKSTKNRALQKVIAKSAAGLMNAEGGTLLIGVTDDGRPCGIEPDIATLSRKDLDGFEQTLRQVLFEHLGPAASKRVQSRYERVGEATVAVLDVPPAEAPVFVEGKEGSEFFVRVGNTTRPLDAGASHRYISSHFPG
jgi:hypothetical protein